MKTATKRWIVAAIVVLMLALVACVSLPFMLRADADEGAAEFIIAGYDGADYTFSYHEDGDTPWAYNMSRDCFYANAADAINGDKIIELTFTKGGSFTATFTVDLTDELTSLFVEYDGGVCYTVEDEEANWWGVQSFKKVISIDAEEGKTFTVTLVPNFESDTSSTVSFTIDGYTPSVADYTINETWFESEYGYEEPFYYTNSSNTWSGRVCADWGYEDVTMALTDISDNGLISFNVEAYLEAGAQFIIGAANGNELTTLYTISEDNSEYREVNKEITIDAALIHALGCDTLVFEITFDSSTYNYESDEYYYDSHVYISDLKEPEQGEFVFGYGDFDYDPDTGNYSKTCGSYDDYFELSFNVIKTGYITFALDFSLYNVQFEIWAETDYYNAYVFGYSYDDMEDAYGNDERLEARDRTISLYTTAGNPFEFRIMSYDDSYDTPNGNVTVKNLSPMAILSGSTNDVAGGSIKLNDDEPSEGFTEQYFSSEETVTLTAIPNDEYEFLYWYDATNEEIVCEDEIFTIVGPRGVVEYVAYFAYHGVLETLNPATSTQYWEKTTSGDETTYFVDIGKHSSSTGWTGTMTFEFVGERWIQFEYAYHSSSTWNNFKVLVDGVEQVSSNSYSSSIKDKTFQSSTVHARGEGVHTLTFQVYISGYSSIYTHFCEVKNLKISTGENVEDKIPYIITYDERLGDVYLEGTHISSGEPLEAMEGYYGHFLFVAKQNITSTADPTRKTNAVVYNLKSGSGDSLMYSGNRGKDSVNVTIKFSSVGIANGSYDSTDHNINVEFQEILLPLEQIKLTKTVAGQEDEETVLVEGSEVHVPFATENTLAFTFAQFEPSADVTVRYTVKVNGTTIASDSMEGDTGDIVGNTRGFALENVAVDTKVVVSTYIKGYYTEPTLTFNIIIDEPGSEEELAGLNNLKTTDSEAFTMSHNDVNKWRFAPELSTTETFVYKAFTGTYSVSQIKFTFPTTGTITFEVHLNGRFFMDSQNDEIRYSRLLYSFKGRIPTDEKTPGFKQYIYGRNVKTYLNSGTFYQLAAGNDPDSGEHIAPDFDAQYVTLLDDGWLRCQIPVTKVGDMWLAFCADTTSVHCYIRNIGFYTGSAPVTFEVKDYDGNVSKAQISALNGQTAIQSGANVTMGNSIKLTLTGLDTNNYQFYGWVMNDKLMSTATTWSFTVSKSNATVYAWVAPKGAYVARNEGKFYTSVEDACEAAKANDTVYVIENNATIKRSFTIPKGVDLVLPMNSANQYYVKAGSTTNHVAWYTTDSEKKYLYYTLNIDSGVTVTIEGNFFIGGTLHRGDRSAQAHTSGAYSHLVNNGTIEVASGGVMDVYGRVTGDGEINVRKGGYLYQPFLILDYGGGSNTQDLFNKNQVPFKRYAMINIECKFTVYYGGILYGHASLYFWSSIHTMDEPFISYKNAPNYSDRKAILLLEGENSYVTVTYDAEKKITEIHKPDMSVTGTGECWGHESVGLTHMTFNGGGSLEYMEFPLGINTAEVAFAIPYNFDVVLENGTFNINYPYKLMPGAKLTVAQGATLNIGADFYVYDGLVQQSMSGGIYPQPQDLQNAGYSTNANFIVNGTLNVNKGTFLGVIQSQCEGAIMSIAEGVVLSGTIVDGGLGTYDCNYATFRSTARVWNSLGDGSFAQLEAGKTYVSKGGNATFTLPGLSVTYESGPHHSSATHATKVAQLDPVSGLCGSWKVQHSVHVADWTLQGDEGKFAGGGKFEVLTRHCTEMGCEETLERVLIRSDAFAGLGAVYSGKAFSAEEVQQLALQLLGLENGRHGFSLYAVLESNPMTNQGTYNVTLNFVGGFVQGKDASTLQVQFVVSPFDLNSQNEQDQALVAGMQQAIKEYLDGLNLTYNGQPHTPNLTETLSALFNGAALQGSFNWQNNTNAGTATLTINGTGNFAGSISVQFGIAKAQLTVEAMGKSKSYDGQPWADVENAKFGVDYNVTAGEVFNNDLTFGITVADADKNVGSYNVSLSATGATDNYELTLTGGTYQIAARDIAESGLSAKVTGLDGLNYVYNGSEQKPEVGLTVVLGGDQPTTLGKEDFSVAFGDAVRAGTVTVTVTGQGNFAGELSASYQIARAQISVAVNEGLGHVYGQTPADVTKAYTLGGSFVESEQAAIREAITLSVEATQWSPAKEDYGVSVQFAEHQGVLANYDVQVQGKPTYKVSTKDILDVEFGVSDAFTFDRNAKTLSKQQISATLNGYSEVTFQIEEDSYQNNTNAGQATVTVRGTGNFSGTKEVHFAIERAQITKVTVQGAYTYNGTAQNISLLVEAGALQLQSSEYTATFGGSKYNGTVTAAGQYTVTIASNSDNFAIGQDAPSASFSVAPKAVTVTPKAQSKTYDGQNAVLAQDEWEVAGSDLANGDGREALGVSLSFVDAGDVKNVGTYKIQGASTATNYSVSFRNAMGNGDTAEFTINRAELTVTINKTGHVYGTNPVAPTAELGGSFVAGEKDAILKAITLTAPQATQWADVGTYAINAAYTDTGVLANYTVTVSNNNSKLYEVTAKSIEDVTATAANVVYNGKAQEAALTITFANYIEHFVKDKDYTVSYSSDSTPVNAGQYTVTVTANKDGNYTGSFTCSYVVEQAEITSVEVQNAYTYNGKVQKPTLLVKAGELTLGESEYSAAYAKGEEQEVKNAGQYTVTVTAQPGGNYKDGTQPASTTFEVARKDIALAEVQVKGTYVYNGKPQTPLASEIEATVEGLTVTFTVSSAANNKDATGDKLATVTIEGTGNFTGSATGSFAIGKKRITLVPNDVQATYGDIEQTLTYTVQDNGLAEGEEQSEVLAVTLTRDPGNDAKAYTIRISQASAANYEITFSATATYTIQPKHVEVAISNQSVVYNGRKQTAEGRYLDNWTLAEGSQMAYSQEPTLLGVTLTGSGTNVTAEGYVISGTASNSNYDVTFRDGRLFVTKATVTVTPDNKQSPEGEALQPLTFSVEGYFEDEQIFRNTIAIAVNGDAQHGTAGSEFTIEVQFDDGTTADSYPNYEVKFATGTYTITDRVFKGVTFERSEVEYNGEAHTISVSGLDLDGAHKGASVTYTFDGGKEFTSATNAGTYEVTATIRLGSYNELVLTATLVIKQRVVSVTIADKQSVYGQELQQLTFTYNGHVAKDQAEVEGAVTLHTNATPRSNINGKYTITASFAELTNYTFRVTNSENHAAYTLSARPLTVHINDQHATYSGLEPSVSSVQDVDWQVTSDLGIVSGDELGVTLHKEQGVGYRAQGYVISGSASGNAAQNYNITWQTGTFGIDKKDVTITANAATSVFGRALAQLYASVQGLMQPDEFVSGVDYKLSTDATQYSDVDGEYTVTVEFIAADKWSNYSVTVQNSTYTLTRGDLSDLNVSLAGSTVTYDGKTHSLEVSNAPADAEITYTYTLNGENTAIVRNVGTYSVQAVVSHRNYNTATFSAELTISAKNVTVTILDQTAVYNGAKPTLNNNAWSVDALGEGDEEADLNVELTLQQAERYGVGTYRIQGGWTNLNYNVTFTGEHSQNNWGDFAVTATQVHVDIHDQTATYSGSTAPVVANTQGTDWTIQTGSVAVGDSLNIRLYLQSADKYIVGEYHILGDWNNNDYEVTFAQGTFTVTPKQITVTIGKAQSVTYNGQIPQVPQDIWQTDGLAAGDERKDLNVQLHLVDGAAAVNTYKVGGQYDNSNYTVSFVQGSLTVQQAAVTVTLEDQTAVYSGKVPTLGSNRDEHWHVTSGKVFNNDDLGVQLTAAATDVGSSDIQHSWTNTNYNVTFVGGRLTISARTIEDAHNSQVADVTYNGSQHKPQVTLTIDGVEGEITFSTDYAANTAAGVGTITLRGIGNFTGTKTVTFAINRAELTVTINKTGHVYGTNPVAPTAELGGSFVAGEKDAILKAITLTAPQATQWADVGTYAINAAYTDTGVLANYTVTVSNNNSKLYEVTAKSIEDVTATAANVVYNGKAQEAMLTITFANYIEHFVKDKDYTVSYNSDSMPVNAGQYTVTVTANKDGNYTGSFTCSYVVEQAEITSVEVQNAYTYNGKVQKPTLLVKAGELTLGESEYSAAYAKGEEQEVKNAGQYTVTVTAQPGGNYKDGTQPVRDTFTVEKKAITVKANDVSVQYGEYINGHADLTFTAQGVEEGEDPAEVLKVELSINATIKDVGQYVISGSGSADNYTFTVQNGTYHVTQREITVRIHNAQSVYNGLEPTVDQTAWETDEGAIIAEDNLHVVLTKQPGVNVLQGGYTIGGTYTNSNYHVTFEEGTYTILPKDVTVVIEDQQSTYIYTHNYPFDALKWHVLDESALVEGETASTLEVVISTEQMTDVGEYAISGTHSNPNYNVTFQSASGQATATYKVTQRDVSADAFFWITADSPDIQNDGSTVYITYAGQDITLTATVTYLEGDNSRTLEATLDRHVISEINVYSVTVTVQDVNYIGSATFSVIVTDADGYTQRLKDTLSRLEEIAGSLSAEELTAEDFDALKEVNELLQALDEAEYNIAKDRLDGYKALVEAWEGLAELDEIINTAESIAKAPISALLGAAATISGLAALCYVIGKGGLL